MFMIRQEITVLIFKLIWSFLLVVVVLAQVLFKGKLIKKGGFIATLLVAAPYLVVFGWFSARQFLGTFETNIIVQVLGVVIAIFGASGYIASILYLRRNWSVTAAIKEGHSLVKSGPYKIVRHPMYFFMTLVVLGSGMLISNFFIILYTPVVLFLYYLRAKKEEEMLKQSLPDYEEYCRKIKMFIPGII